MHSIQHLYTCTSSWKQGCWQEGGERKWGILPQVLPYLGPQRAHNLLGIVAILFTHACIQKKNVQHVNLPWIFPDNINLPCILEDTGHLSNSVTVSQHPVTVMSAISGWNKQEDIVCEQRHIWSNTCLDMRIFSYHEKLSSLSDCSIRGDCSIRVFRSWFIVIVLYKALVPKLVLVL